MDKKIKINKNYFTMWIVITPLNIKANENF